MKEGNEKKNLFKKGKNKRDKEKILVAVLFSVIFLLAIYIGYDIYDSFQTQDETSYLNGAVISLSKEKSQLLLERDSLNATVNTLTQQKTQLNTENNELIADKESLTLELEELQDDYDALSGELAAVEDDLDDCLNP